MFNSARLLAICSLLLIVQFGSSTTLGQQKIGQQKISNRYERYVDGIFRTYDKNKDSYLDSTELNSMRRPKRDADANNDGKVSKEEYVSYYQAGGTRSAKSDIARDAAPEVETTRMPQIIYVKHASANSVGEMASKLLNLKGVRVVTSKRLNALVASGSEEQLTRLQEFVSMLDVDSKSKPTAESQLRGLLGGGSAAILSGGIANSIGGSKPRSRSGSKTSKASKKAKVNNKRVRVAMTFLKAPKDAENQGEAGVEDLRETSFEDLPEKIQALAGDGFEILDQGTSVTFDGVKSEFSVGGVKPVVVGESTTGEGGTRQILHDKNIGSKFEFKPKLESGSGRLEFDFSKVLVDEVARENDTPASYNELNVTICSTIACPSNGTTAVTYRTDEQLFVLVIGTRIED